MHVLGVGFDLSEKDREFIVKVIKGSGFGEWPVVPLDIRTSSIEIEDVSLVVIFGERAARSVVPISRERGLLYTVIPSIKNLYLPSEGGNEKDRAEAFKLLCDLKLAMKSGRLQVLDDRKILSSLKPELAPDLTLPVIQGLEKKLNELGKKTWMMTTKDGKVICLTTDSSMQKTDGVDILVSFAEMMAIRAAMDVFKVQEIEYVKHGDK
jgi:hypothetical protein